ncbi:MAG: heavy metal-binding domain-containing protein [Bacteroidales bacterium]
MKKLIITLVVAFSLGSLFSSCMAMHGSSASQSYSMDSHFSCKMHPEVYRVSTGKCPKCGMELVFIRADQGNSGHGSSSGGGHHH